MVSRENNFPLPKEDTEEFGKQSGSPWSTEVVNSLKFKIQEQAKQNMSIGGSSDKKGSPNGETL